MVRFLFLVFCLSSAWLATPVASAAPTRHYPRPGDHRPVYKYYHGGGNPSHNTFWTMFRKHSGTRQVKPHVVGSRRRGTR